jgi:hypothetical protein
MTRFHIDHEGGIHSTIGKITPDNVEYFIYVWLNLPTYGAAIALTDFLKTRHATEVKAEFDLGWID